MDISIFAQRARQARKNRGLTLRAASQCTGLHYTRLCRIEGGENATHDLSTVLALADGYQVSLDWLCGRQLLWHKDASSAEKNVDAESKT